jgi:hypothetical protein
VLVGYQANYTHTNFLSISSLSEAEMSMFLFSFNSCGSHGLISAPVDVCVIGVEVLVLQTVLCEQDVVFTHLCRALRMM